MGRKTQYLNFIGKSKLSIYEYKKQRLFKRFALDNFAAIMVLKEKKKKVHPGVLSLYEAVVEKRGEEILKKRIVDIHSNRFVPNFRKEVR